METRYSISNQRKRLFQYIEDFYGTEPEYLWAKYPTYAVFRHSASRKWFAAVMELSRDKPGLPGGGCVDILNVKCDSVLIGSLLAEAGFFPAYHMKKIRGCPFCLMKQYRTRGFFLCWHGALTVLRRKGNGRMRIIVLRKRKEIKIELYLKS